MPSRNVVRTDFSRVFLLEDGANGSGVPVYEGLWKAGAVSWNFGDIKLVREPDPNRYGGFLTVGKIPGDIGMPQLPITARYSTDLSDLLRLARKGCDQDLQIHFGECRNPQDFDGGWDKIGVLERAKLISYTTGMLGALEPGERALVDETVPFHGENYYEIKRLTFEETGQSEVISEIVDIVVCDQVSCGACGITSDGCSVLFAAGIDAAGSPSTSPYVLFSLDGGKTWTVADDELAGTPLAIACVGPNLIVLETGGVIEFAPLANIVAGTVVAWQTLTITDGGQVPTCIFSAGPRDTWFGGTGGYIWFTTDPTQGATVQDAGSATSNPIVSISGADNHNILAGGLDLVFTNNGGLTWQLIPDPSGSTYQTVFAKNENEWWLGDLIGGVYYTRDGGLTFTSKTYPGKSASPVKDIRFVTGAVGYMIHNLGTSGVILRTINGGSSWYVLPEGSATMPNSYKLDKLAICGDANKVFAGGLGLGATHTDGIILVGA